jgi:AbrB family looped-hinge helix DNA binding protein
MSTAVVSAKGWIVIPAALRRKYGIDPGTRIHIVDYGGVLALVPALDDPVRQGRGLLGGGRSLTAALLEERRQERERGRGSWARAAQPLPGRPAGARCVHPIGPDRRRELPTPF